MSWQFSRFLTNQSYMVFSSCSVLQIAEALFSAQSLRAVCLQHQTFDIVNLIRVLGRKRAITLMPSQALLPQKTCDSLGWAIRRELPNANQPKKKNVNPNHQPKSSWSILIHIQPNFFLLLKIQPIGLIFVAGRNNNKLQDQGAARKKFSMASRMCFAAS